MGGTMSAVGAGVGVMSGGAPAAGVIFGTTPTIGDVASVAMAPAATTVSAYGGGTEETVLIGGGTEEMVRSDGGTDESVLGFAVRAASTRGGALGGRDEREGFVGGPGGIGGRVAAVPTPGVRRRGTMGGGLLVGGFAVANFIPVPTTVLPTAGGLRDPASIASRGPSNAGFEAFVTSPSLAPELPSDASPDLPLSPSLFTGGSIDEPIPLLPAVIPVLFASGALPRPTALGHRPACVGPRAQVRPTSARRAPARDRGRSG